MKLGPHASAFPNGKTPAYQADSVNRVALKVVPHVVPHRCRDLVTEDGLREVDPFAIPIPCVAKVFHAATARNKKDKKGGKTPERHELHAVHGPATCTHQKLQLHLVWDKQFLVLSRLKAFQAYKNEVYLLPKALDENVTKYTFLTRYRALRPYSKTSSFSRCQGSGPHPRTEETKMPLSSSSSA